MASTQEFKTKLLEKLSEAKSSNKEFIDILSKDLHENCDGNNEFPKCCNAMNEVAQEYKYEILKSPPKGQGSTLLIRYYL